MPNVANFLPTISAAIGGFSPQNYVWRICISLVAGIRLMMAFSYYQWHLRVNMGLYHLLYKRLVMFAVLCYVIENIALVTLTSVSSTDNFSIHENSFIVFMVCSLIYMLLSCCLIKWSHLSGAYKVTPTDVRHFHMKTFLFVFNISVFLFSVYLYFRHNAYCEPYIYSWFALGEYLTVLSNIAFHGFCCIDFSQYSFALVPTEDVQTGKFKN
ncbi:Post-GPI attachment to proteins factor 2 [Mactra antiquata]